MTPALFNVGEDFLRLWVLLLGVGVLALYVRSCCITSHRLRAQLKRADPALHAVVMMQVGHLCRQIGCLVLLGDELMDVSQRLGKSVFTYETPLAQVSCILLLLAWHFLDRRRYQDENESIDAAIRKAQGRPPRS